MNKNINTGVELTEKELEGIEGGTDQMSFIETRTPIID